jgi:DNA topoisomerase VI subunit B
MKAIATLERTAFSTSVLLDFCSRRELVTQTGHEPHDWPLVALKELVDNALDAAEEAGIAPEIAVRVDETGIMVQDNGPGLPPEVVGRVLDFSTRTSSRATYISPSRGQQGNAMKTIIAMPFVLDGQSGGVEIEAHGVRHTITFTVDQIRQKPLIHHQQEAGLVKTGTRFTVHWPLSSQLNPQKRRGQIFTNRRRLHVAEPAPDAQHRRVRPDEHHRGNPAVVAEVAAMRSDIAALV